MRRLWLRRVLLLLLVVVLHWSIGRLLVMVAPVRSVSSGCPRVRSR